MCINMLELPPSKGPADGYWTAATTVTTLIARVLKVLEEPEMHRAANLEAHVLYATPGQEKYRERVLQTTELTYRQPCSMSAPWFCYSAAKFVFSFLY
jgi:ubiquitin-protein ligase